MCLDPGALNEGRQNMGMEEITTVVEKHDGIAAQNLILELLK